MSVDKYWTGVGSRSVEEKDYNLLISIGRRMTELGYTLLSGAADGSDTLFHMGVCDVDPTKAKIMLPWKRFNVYPTKSIGYTEFAVLSNEQFQIARKFYLDTGIISWFDKMSQGVQKLHARNYYQVVQPDNISKVCIYYADENEKGEVSGGTRSAVMVSRHYNIPCYNLKDIVQREKLELKIFY